MAKKPLNPMDAHRKAQRKKELKKNKEDKKKTQQFRSLQRDADKIFAELDRIDELEAQGKLDHIEAARRESATLRLKQLSEQRQDVGLPPFVRPQRTTAASGRKEKWYHPTFNPHGPKKPANGAGDDDSDDSGDSSDSESDSEEKTEKQKAMERLLSLLDDKNADASIVRFADLSCIDIPEGKPEHPSMFYENLSLPEIRHRVEAKPEPEKQESLGDPPQNMSDQVPVTQPPQFPIPPMNLPFPVPPPFQPGYIPPMPPLGMPAIPPMPMPMPMFGFPPPPPPINFPVPPQMFPPPGVPLHYKLDSPPMAALGQNVRPRPPPPPPRRPPPRPPRNFIVGDPLDIDYVAPPPRPLPPFPQNFGPGAVRGAPSQHEQPSLASAPSLPPKPSVATISAAPQLRDLQKELTHLVPPSLLKRKRQSGVVGANGMVINRPVDSAPRAVRSSVVKTHVDAAPAVTKVDVSDMSEDEARKLQSFLAEIDK